jgi:hypothetical protein
MIKFENRNRSSIMKVKNVVRIVSLAAILAIGVIFLSQTSAASAAETSRGGRGGNGQAAGLAAPGRGYALTPLSAEEEGALQEAILEEYGALNLYQSAISQLGSVYPFGQIVQAEEQHVLALVRQADKYGVVVPDNLGLTSQTTFDTLAQACQTGVSAEIADAELYDSLKIVTTHADLLNVYNNLQSASLNSHLPAFQSCD